MRFKKVRQLTSGAEYLTSISFAPFFAVCKLFARTRPSGWCMYSLLPDAKILPCPPPKSTLFSPGISSAVTKATTPSSCNHPKDIRLHLWKVQSQVLKDDLHLDWRTIPTNNGRLWPGPERSHWSTSAMYTSFCLCCNAFWVLAVQWALDKKQRRFWFSKFLLVWSRWEAVVCELYLECLGWVNAVYDCQSMCGGHDSSK